eukprot:363221-Chlamydomonas_euryale.AAC.12
MHGATRTGHGGRQRALLAEKLWMPAARRRPEPGSGCLSVVLDFVLALTLTWRAHAVRHALNGRERRFDFFPRLCGGQVAVNSERRVPFTVHHSPFTR